MDVIEVSQVISDGSLASGPTIIPISAICFVEKITSGRARVRFKDGSMLHLQDNYESVVSMLKGDTDE